MRQSQTNVNSEDHQRFCNYLTILSTMTLLTSNITLTFAFILRRLAFTVCSPSGRDSTGRTVVHALIAVGTKWTVVTFAWVFTHSVLTGRTYDWKTVNTTNEDTTGQWLLVNMHARTHARTHTHAQTHTYIYMDAHLPTRKNIYVNILTIALLQNTA